MIKPLGVGYVLAENAPDVAVVGNDLWLLELLSDHPHYVLPVDEVLRRARADGRNVGSINSHLSFSPLIRKDQGLVHLVGAKIDPDEADVLRRAARAMRIPSSIAYSSEPDGTELVMTLGTNYLKSGVVTVNQELRALIGDKRPNVACCDAVAFDVRLGLEGGTWYGWSSLFNHLVSHHRIGEGDIVRFLMTDDLVRCQEPWAVQDAADASETYTAVSGHSETPSEPILGQQLRVVDPTAGIRPGEPWPEPRGSKTLVLSIKSRALAIPGGASDGTARTVATLTEKYGHVAAHLAEEMLKIRPSGGRVWVDRDGHATTLLDGQLTYLGQLPRDWTW